MNNFCCEQVFALLFHEERLHELYHRALGMPSVLDFAPVVDLDSCHLVVGLNFGVPEEGEDMSMGYLKL